MTATATTTAARATATASSEPTQSPPWKWRLRERLGGSATFLGWLAGDELSRVYAAADAFLFASQTDTFGQVILEAQASGLPVVAVNRGGPASLIVPGGGLQAVRRRSWEAALDRLAAGYRLALDRRSEQVRTAA